MASSSSPDAAPATRLKIAVVGCGHGGLDTIYSDLEIQCISKGWSISDLELLIICGDFQAIRNELDLNCMSVPRRYRRMGDFHKYYSGAAQAPVLTLVIGGNHEASNYFFELYHGGWLAPNIYYLGATGIVRYGPCRIVGLSGIYKAPDYRKPREERLPYDRDMIRSIYHVREYDVQKLLQVSAPIDVALSHDWPAWVELFGDYNRLFADKPHFLESAKVDALGSKPAAEVLNHLRPSYWFSGHMHTKFHAVIDHHGFKMEDTVARLTLPGELKKCLPIFKRLARGSPTSSEQHAKHRQKTEFLALSKVGHPVASYLELMEIDVPRRSEDAVYTQSTKDGKFSLCYDEEWLAITRAYADRLNIPDPETLVLPPARKHQTSVAPEVPTHRQWVKENITDKNLLKVPDNFVCHAPQYDAHLDNKWEQPQEYPNQQIAALAELLQIANKFAINSTTDYLDKIGG